MPSALSLEQLPVEILLGICRDLDITNILRIRRVSRYLNEISHCRDVWADAYRKADFVRPPGPFPSQSASELENVLVPSFRVAQNLRHGGGERPARKLGAIQYTGVALRVSLVFGRVLLVALRGEVRCYDLSQIDPFNSNSDGSILHRSVGRTLTSFYCVSAIDMSGRPFACVVIKEEGKQDKLAQISIYKLLDKPTVTLDLVHQFECSMFTIHSVDLGPRVIVVLGNASPPPADDRCVVVVDVHTRAQFLLPLTDETWKIEEKPEDTSFFISSISTSTHVILSRSFCVPTAGWSAIFNSYALPLPTAHADSTPLRLSHRGIIPDTLSDHLVSLHDAIRDPSTQDILITIRLSTFDSSCCDVPLLKHGTLCLRKSRPGEVGTITIQALGSLGKFPQDLFDRPSFNGIGRVFYIAPPWAHGTVAAFEYNVRGDNTESKVREYPSILRFPTPRRLLDFDPYCGRVCLQSMERYNVIEIWDFCVVGDLTKRTAPKET